MADRRAGAAARLERRLRRRLPRRRGGRVGSHRVRARAGDRRRHEPRARPPHASSRRRRSSRREFERWLAGVPHVVRDAPPYRRRARAAGRAQPAERRRGARGARARRRRARRGGAVARAVHRHRPAVRGPRGRRRAPSSTTTATTRPRSRRRSRPARERFPDAACACSSSRTSTRARGISRASSPTRSPPRTTSRSPTSIAAREAPVPGVTGKLIVDALSDRGVLAGVDADRRAGRGAARPRAPRRRRAARPRRRRRRPGRRDADSVDRGERLARAATRRSAPAAPRAGSRAPRRSTSCRRRCAGRATRGVAVEVIGLGSNVLVHDDGVDALVIRLARRARRGARRRERARRGRRRAERGLPSPRARRRARRLRVRLGDPRDGGRRCAHERRRVRPRVARRAVDALVVDADGSTHGAGVRARALLPPLGASAGPGRGARPVPARAELARRREGDGRGAARAAQGDPADEQADVRQRLQEPERGARSRPRDRGVRSQGPPDRRRAHLAAPRELHRERGRRDARPTASP